MPDKQANKLVPGLEEAHRILEETGLALEHGRTPRAGKQLTEAIRQLLDAKETAPAARGYRLLAQLELRRGKPEKALRPARAAERLLRDQEGTELAASYDLLSRVYAENGDHERAVSIAQLWASRAAGNPGRLRQSAAYRRLALAHWTGGEVSAAFVALDQVLQVEGAHGENPADACRVELLAGELLTRVGCPRAAADLFTRYLKQQCSPEDELRALLGRGWAVVSSGSLESAVRSFRKARRVAAGLDNERLDAETAAALAAAEYLRAPDGDSAQLASRLRRRSRQAARVGLASLARATELLAEAPTRSSPPSPEAVPYPSPGMPVILHSPTPKDAAQRLVSLAQATPSLTLVDGCCLEVDYLQDLPSNQNPYPLAHWLPAVSLE